MKAIWTGMMAAALYVIAFEAHAAPPPKAIYFFDRSNKKWCGYRSLAELKRRVAEADQFEVEAGGIYFSASGVTKIEEAFTNADAEVALLASYVVNPDGSISEAKATLQDEGKHVWRFDVHRRGYAPVSKPRGFTQSVPQEFRTAGRLSAFPFSKLIEAFAKAPNSREICL